MDRNGTNDMLTHLQPDHHSPPAGDNPTTAADLLLLKTWETERSMHLGIMLELDSRFTCLGVHASNSKHLPAVCPVFFLKCGATSWPVAGRH